MFSHRHFHTFVIFPRITLPHGGAVTASPFPGETPWLPGFRPSTWCGASAVCAGHTWPQVSWEQAPVVTRGAAGLNLRGCPRLHGHLEPWGSVPCPWLPGPAVWGPDQLISVTGGTWEALAAATRSLSLTLALHVLIQLGHGTCQDQEVTQPLAVSSLGKSPRSHLLRLLGAACWLAR